MRIFKFFGCLAVENIKTKFVLASMSLIPTEIPFPQHPIRNLYRIYHIDLSKRRENFRRVSVSIFRISKCFDFMEIKTSTSRSTAKAISKF